jgi:hypothetical protein
VLEFYNSLDTIFQVTIIVWLIALFLKWGGGFVVGILTLIVACFSETAAVIVAAITGVFTLVLYATLAVCTMWSIVKLFFILI